MSKNTFLLTIVVLFNYFILNVLGKNNYYIVSIRRNKKDKEYDNSSDEDQYAIDKLVNDRMNDIYDIINDNKESYANADGKMDEKLEELDAISELRKRQEGEGDKKVKFKFINKNRPQKMEKRKVKLASEEDELIDYIPFESSLVVHICPVSNYYVVIAYLSDELVSEIQSLPNVISCVKSQSLKMDRSIASEKEFTRYYDESEILKETQWKGLGIQEYPNNVNFINTHLSPVSQGVYENSSGNLYDNNYYFPSSAGKGIDIYIIDDGLDTSYSEEDFDTYEGTPNERIIKCEGKIYEGQFHEPDDERKCIIEEDPWEINHGTVVSMSAAGTVYGAAKKANIHMLAVEIEVYNILTALDFIKQNAIPHKTVVNISMGCNEDDDEKCKDPTTEEKIQELANSGIIIFVAAGNESSNRCQSTLYAGSKGVIAIGAINNKNFRDYNLGTMYKMADYSNFGECVELFAPGTIVIPDMENDYLGHSGTSYSSPIVAGIAATLMTDDPETKYTMESMKQKLIDLSIKDVIKNMDENTPNRLVNNGKRSIYAPPRCDDPSGDNSCGEHCCSQYGFCVDPQDPQSKYQCLTENGCLSEFGYCTTQLCGINHNGHKCDEGQCCSKEGRCVDPMGDADGECLIENGCLKEYSGICLTMDMDKIDEYDDKYKALIYKHRCFYEITPYMKGCYFVSQLFNSKAYQPDNRVRLCETYKHLDCAKFFNNTYDVAPTCQKIGYTFDVDLSVLTEIAGEDLFCAKKDPTSAKDFCDYAEEIVSEEYYHSSEFKEIHLKEHCRYDECRDKMYKYLKASYDIIQDLEVSDSEEQLTSFQESMDYLLSDECSKINEEYSHKVTTTTTTPVQTKTKSTKTKATKTKATKTKATKTKSTKSNTSIKATTTKTKKTKATKTKNNNKTKTKTTKRKTQ